MKGNIHQDISRQAWTGLIPICLLGGGMDTTNINYVRW